MSTTTFEHKQTLTSFGQELTKEGYSVYPVTVEQPTGTYEALIVLVDSYTDPTQCWQVELSFLPSLEQDLQTISILQCFAPISVGVAEATEPTLAGLLTQINTRLPLVGFGFLAETKTLYFKYNAVLPNANSTLSTALVAEIIPLIGFLLNNFAISLFEVANGQKSADQAMRENAFRHIYR